MKRYKMFAKIDIPLTIVNHIMFSKADILIYITVAAFGIY